MTKSDHLLLKFDEVKLGSLGVSATPTMGGSLPRGTARLLNLKVIDSGIIADRRFLHWIQDTREFVLTQFFRNLNLFVGSSHLVIKSDGKVSNSDMLFSSGLGFITEDEAIDAFVDSDKLIKTHGLTKAVLKRLNFHDWQGGPRGQFEASLPD